MRQWVALALEEGDSAEEEQTAAADHACVALDGTFVGTLGAAAAAAAVVADASCAAGSCHRCPDPGLPRSSHTLVLNLVVALPSSFRAAPHPDVHDPDASSSWDVAANDLGAGTSTLDRK